MEAKKFAPQVNETPEQRLLQARAKRLAERIDEQATRPDEVSILIFNLGKERFAVKLNAIAAVVPFTKLTVVPGVDSRIIGVMPVRGEPQTIVHLGRALELAEHESPTAEGRVLLLRWPGAHVGLYVDQVETIDAVEAQAIQGPKDGPDRDFSGRRFIRPRATTPLVLIEDLKTILGSLINGENQ